MERIYDVAQYIFDEYKKVSGKIIDAMKLQKLLYFTQRESFAILGVPMFDAEFKGWEYGPVCPSVHSAYTTDGLSVDCNEISSENAYIIRNVIAEYGVVESWELSNMSHKEISWKKSRLGLNANENGNVSLKIEDIKKDAEKVRPYDHMWDMFYDEFDDTEIT